MQKSIKYDALKFPDKKASGTTSATGTPPQPVTRKITPRIGPNGRMMVKSYSQDAASNMAAVAASASTTAGPNTSSSTNVSEMQPSMTSSVSEIVINKSQVPTTTASTASTSVLTAKPPLPKSASSSVSSIGAPVEASLTSSVSQHSLRPPTVEEESQSDTGSLGSELDASGKKSKKKRSFFNFRRKKEKLP